LEDSRQLLSLSVGKQGSRPKAYVEGIEPRKSQEVGKADVVTDTESYILIIDMVRLLKLSRGLRPWHVTHGYDTATRETLSVLAENSVEYGNPSDNKARKPDDR